MADADASAVAPPEPRAAPAPRADGSDGGEAEGSESVFFVSLSYKGTAYEVPVQAEDSIASIFDFVQEALDFPRENCKLISRGKMLRPDHDSITVGEAGLQAGAKLMLVASSTHDISFVQSSRADPLVKGFAEEERDEIARRKRARAAGASAWGTKQDSQYRFNSIKAEFKYSEPPPFEAEKLLERLATDPGIIDIMKSRGFTVGILTEMSPIEAQKRMAQRGTPNMDLLGYNQNAGEMIVLRLRTDNLKGFRPYHDLINTLIHELTHNVWGPHDDKFWKLYGELKAQYMRFHRFWSHGGRAADSGPTGQFQGFVGGDDEDGQGAGSGGFGHTLGGGDYEGRRPLSPRTRAVMAAEARAAMGNGPDEPPKPNFLAGDGRWVLLCPCGQVHDPAGCEVAQGAAAAAAAASSSAPSAPAEPGLAEAAPQPPADAGAAIAPDEAGDAVMEVLTEGLLGAGAVVVTARPEEALAPQGRAQEEEEGEDAEMPAASPAAVEAEDVVMEDPPPAAAAPAAAAAAPAGPPQPQPVPPEPRARPRREPWSCPVCTLDNAAEASACAACDALRPPQATSSASTAVPAADPDLDLAELEAQGLDGASVWLARFSQRLRALRAVARRAQAEQARAAVELLLRLVSNVVDSPNDPKFRRIRADNPKIRAGLMGAGQEAEAIMSMLGFEAVSEPSGSKVFVLRDAAFDTARLRLGKELLEQELASVSFGTA